MHPTTGAAHDEDEDDGASIEVPTAITPGTDAALLLARSANCEFYSKT